MRHSILIPGLLLLFFCACGKSFVPAEETASVCFTVSQEQSKVTGVTYAEECAVERWSVFVFDTRSGSFRYAVSEGNSSLTLPLQAGRPYLCMAVVNYPISGPGAFRPETVSSVGDIAGKTAYLEDNAPGSLLMFGEDMLYPVAGAGEKTLRVRRLVSRLEVSGIQVDCPQWEGKTLVLRHIYLTNVCRTSEYGMDCLFPSAGRSAWYNTLGWHGGGEVSAGMDALLGNRDINAEITAAHPYSTTHCFYFYPNPTEEDSHRTDCWTPRLTRLVLEASVDGETYYYPVSLPPVGRNRLVSARNILLHGPGVSHPEGGTLANNLLQVEWDEEEEILLD